MDSVRCYPTPQRCPENRNALVTKTAVVSFSSRSRQEIRNHYQLWQDKALLAEIGKEHPDDASGVIIEAVWDKLRETEAKDLGFCEAECVDCGESVLVANEEIHVSGKAWCYDCEKRDQAYEPSMTGGK